MSFIVHSIFTDDCAQMRACLCRECLERAEASVFDKSLLALRLRCVGDIGDYCQLRLALLQGPLYGHLIRSIWRQVSLRNAWGMARRCAVALQPLIESVRG